MGRGFQRNTGKSCATQTSLGASGEGLVGGSRGRDVDASSGGGYGSRCHRTQDRFAAQEKRMVMTDQRDLYDRGLGRETLPIANRPQVATRSGRGCNRPWRREDPRGQPVHLPQVDGSTAAKVTSAPGGSDDAAWDEAGRLHCVRRDGLPDPAGQQHLDRD